MTNHYETARKLLEAAEAREGIVMRPDGMAIAHALLAVVDALADLHVDVEVSE